MKEEKRKKKKKKEKRRVVLILYVDSDGPVQRGICERSDEDVRRDVR